jgi:uncharacterized protein (TIGR03435 family)
MEGNMRNRAIAAGVSLAIFGLPRVSAQAPKFEVASVRLSDPDDKKSAAAPRLWGEETGRVSLHHIPLGYLIQHTYDLQPDQVSGPGWLNDQFFDILATVPAGTPKERIPRMFESLLAERFKFTFHRETHTEKVLALVVGKGGSKLKDPLPDDPDVKLDHLVATGAVGAENRSLTTYMKTQFGMAKYVMVQGVAHFEYAGMIMQNLAQFLSQPPQFLGLPVVDATGLKGAYQVIVDIPVSALGAAPTASDDSADPTGSIQESLHKMGLDVVRREAQSEKLVIDHIEKTPTPN